MKKLLFFTVAIFTFCFAKAQTAPSDGYFRHTLEEVRITVSEDHNNEPVKDASYDNTTPSAEERRARPQYDYGYTSGGCAYVAHFYQHTFLGIPYGPIYEGASTLVGCI